MPSRQKPMTIPIPTEGIKAHLPPSQIGFSGLVDARNWNYRDGQFFTRLGLIDFADDVDERVLGIHQYDYISDTYNNESDRLVIGTESDIYWYKAGTDAWVSLAAGYAGGATAHVQFRTLDTGGETYLLAINGQAAAKLWDGDDTPSACASFGGGAPSSPIGIAVSNNRVVLASDSDYLYASDSLNPNSGWYPTSPNGYWTRVADTPGSIVGLLEFGNEQFAIYKESSIYMAFAQADLTTKYRIDLIRADISGPVSRNAIFTIGEIGVHCYLAESGDVMLFDGNNITSIGEHVQAFVRSTMDYDLRGRAFGFYDPVQDEIHICYAAVGSSDVDLELIIHFPSRRMHCYRYANHTPTAGISGVASNALTIGDLVTPIDEITLSFGEMDRGVASIIMGAASLFSSAASDGSVYTVTGNKDSHSTETGEISAWFETGLQFGDDPRTFNVLHAVEHLFKPTSSSQNISIYLGSSLYGEDASYTTAQTLNLNTGGPYETQHRLPGRLFALKMQGSFAVPAEWMSSIASMTQTSGR